MPEPSLTPRLEVVGADAPDPPYPVSTKAKGWYFPLDYERIESSDTWALAPADLRPWLLMLWFTAWRQMPMGSLPEDDAMIAARIGMPLTAFQTHRSILLRGWRRCSDGRLYHSVITEIVLAKITQREAELARKARWRATHAGGPRIVPVSSPSRPESRDAAEAEAEAEAEATKVKVNSDMSSSPPKTGAKLDPSAPKPPKPKSKHAEAAKAVLAFVNARTGRHWRPTEITLRPIIARLEEGYSADELRAVFARKKREWETDAKMRAYIRPATIFGAEKFSQYVGEVPPAQLNLEEP